MKTTWKIAKYLIRRENEVVLAARLKGLKVIKPTVVLLVIVAQLYLWSPYDLLAEAWLSPIIAYLDDVLIVLASIAYLVMDLINCKSAMEPDIEDAPNKQQPEERSNEESEVE